MGEYIGESYCGDDFVDLINGIGKRIKANDDFDWIEPIPIQNTP